MVRRPAPGFTLGVAGVGAVYAVPLLVYGVGLPPGDLRLDGRGYRHCADRFH